MLPPVDDVRLRELRNHWIARWLELKYPTDRDTAAALHELMERRQRDEQRAKENPA